jgi:hypothetical protein
MRGNVTKKTTGAQTLPEMEIRVDLGKLTFGDVEDMSNGKLSVTQQFALLNRAVVGGIRHLPVSCMGQIKAAMEAAMKGQTDGPNS